MRFTIDLAYCCSVNILSEWNSYIKPGVETSAEDLCKVLKGEGECSSHSSADHPEFAKLREQLSAEGYISIQRGWWNGDRVLKSFTLNDKQFKAGDQFCCGVAIKYELELATKRKKN